MPTHRGSWANAVMTSANWRPFDLVGATHFPYRRELVPGCRSCTPGHKEPQRFLVISVIFVA